MRILDYGKYPYTLLKKAPKRPIGVHLNGTYFLPILHLLTTSLL